MRLTILTHYFPPEAGAPQARLGALAEGLAARGVEVTVHTCPPHYPDGRIHPPHRNRLRSVEASGPVRIVRSAVYPAANRGFARRLADHASFAASALATAPASGPADVVLAETPPLFTAGAALAYARMKRAPLVLNVADRWPASAVELGMLRNGAAVRAATALERACYRAAAAIACPTRGIARALDALPSARGKAVHISPSVDLSRFDPSPPPATDGGPLRLLYAGTVGLAQGLGTLLDAARLAGPGAVEVTIAGGGADAEPVRRRIEAEGIGNVRLAGIVAHERVPSLHARADAAAVLLRDLPIFREALPTKLLEAMAAARPVILAASGEAAELVERAGAGIVVAPEDPSALAEAIARLRADPDLRTRLGAAGRRTASEGFAREDALERWWRLLDEAHRLSRSRRSLRRAP